MQCVTCILPHLGLQITPGKVASQQTCVLLSYNFEPELATLFCLTVLRIVKVSRIVQRQHRFLGS